MGSPLLLAMMTVVPACSDDGDDDADATSTTPVPGFTEPECDEDVQVAALEQAFAEESNGDAREINRRVAETAARELIELGEEGELEEDCLNPNIRLRTAVMLRFLANADGEVRELFDEGLENVPDQVWYVADQLSDAWYAADDPDDRRAMGDELLTFLDEPSELATSSDDLDGVDQGDVQGVQDDDVHRIRTVRARIGDFLTSYLRGSS